VTVKVNEKTNSKVTEQLVEFPSFQWKCNLAKILEDRGLTLQHLSDLTGVRVATLSELANMKRSTVSVPHTIVIAKALRISDISELFSFEMDEETAEQFEEDQKTIFNQGILPDQEEILLQIRRERRKEKEQLKREKKLIKEFHKKIEEMKAKEKPTSD
jgi:transcriptional regulator with XRE-family HTH domain